MTDTVFMIAVVGAVLLALLVDVAAAVGWVWRMRAAASVAWAWRRWRNEI